MSKVIFEKRLSVLYVTLQDKHMFELTALPIDVARLTATLFQQWRYLQYDITIAHINIPPAKLYIAFSVYRGNCFVYNSRKTPHSSPGRGGTLGITVSYRSAIYQGSIVLNTPESTVHGANMGPTWVLSAPNGPHICHMELAIREEGTKITNKAYGCDLLCFVVVRH